MSGKTRVKDNVNSSASEASLGKKIGTRSSKDNTPEASEQEPAASLAPSSASSLASNPATINMDILIEIRELAKKMNTMDESIGHRLESTDGSLIDIKTSVTTLENSISRLSERTTSLETRVDEAESRISVLEDEADEHNSKLKSLEKMVTLLKQKVDILENVQRRKNLKIVNFPDNVEKDMPLSLFLQSILPTLSNDSQHVPL